MKPGNTLMYTFLLVFEAHWFTDTPLIYLDDIHFSNHWWT